MNIFDLQLPSTRKRLVYGFRFVQSHALDLAKHPLWAALSLSLGLAVLSGCAKKAPPPQPGPPSVTVTAVEQRNVPIYGEWVANLDGYVNAQIQPQVSGYLLQQNYKEGSVVHRGQVLFQIDPRPYQAALDQAKGQLAQSNANLGLANINVKRDTPLSQARAIARSQLDNDVQGQASAEAVVRSSQAGVSTAELNLSFTKVRALIDGIAGLAATQVGSLVSPATVLTTVSQVQPIKAYFAISEQEYLALSNKVRTAGSTDLLHSGARVPLQLTLSNNAVYPEKGYIVFVDRQVNPQTGTIRVAAAFPNRQNLLRPGQFGRIRAQTSNEQNALLVPQKAVTEVQGTYHVAVVDDSDKVHMQSVQVGKQIGQDWLISSGLKAGQRVVTEGTGKLADGMPVHPMPAPATAAADGSRETASKGR